MSNNLLPQKIGHSHNKNKRINLLLEDDFAVSLLTRSLTKECNNLILEPDTMGEQGLREELKNRIA